MEEYDYTTFYSKHKDYDMNRLYSILDTYHKEMALSKSASEMREYYTKIDIIRKMIEKDENNGKNPIKFNEDTASIVIDQDKYYPKLDHEQFRDKLFKHREFKDCEYDNGNRDNGDRDNNHLSTMSHDTFKNIYQRFPWQEFVKNYISPSTPYNGILLWWDVGVGKTPGAISIAEQFRDHIYHMGKKIHVILPGSKLENNWISEFCNLKNLNYSSTGNVYTDIINEEDFEDMERLRSKVKRNIKKYYNFVGYGTLQNELNNYIRSSLKLSDNMGPYIKHLQRTYNDTVIIIDEVHELRRDYKSSTPQENDDDLSDDETTKEKIIPKQFHDLIEDIIRHCTGIKLILLSGTPMYDNWKEMIWLIDLLRKNDKLSPIVPYEESLNTISVGTPNEYTEYITNKKINITPYISYMSGENPETYPRKYFASNNCIKKEGEGSDNYSIGDIPWDPETDENAKLYIYTTETNIDTGGGNAKKRFFKENLNVDKVSDYFLFKMSGKPKSWEITIGEKYEGKKLYDPTDPSNENILSPKINSIIKIASKDKTGKGIHFIYSEYLQYGVYPMALALELEGYTMAYIDNGKLAYRSLIDNMEKTDRDKIKTDHNKGGKTKGHYILLTGAVSDNDLMKLINEAKGIGESGLENKNGEHIKFVLGSSKVEVGFSLWNVRHVHIMEPWYNFSKIDQVIGRSLRSNSHKQLDEGERDVVIYHHMLLYSGSDKNTAENNLGFKYYSSCIKKEADINEIGKFLKEKAVDYILNYNQNYKKQYGDEKDLKRPVKYIFSNNENDPRKKVYSSTEMTIESEDKDDKTVCESLYDRQLHINKYYDYKTKLVETYICDELFDKNYILNIEEIKLEIKKDDCILNNFNFHKNDTKNGRFIYLYKALYNLVNQKTEFINNFNIKGYIILDRDYFIFQPVNLLDKNAPIMYRTGKIDNIIDYVQLDKLEIKKETKNKTIEDINNPKLKKSTVAQKGTVILLQASKKEINFVLNHISITHINERKNELYYIEKILLSIVQIPTLTNGCRYLEVLFVNVMEHINEHKYKKDIFKKDMDILKNYFMNFNTSIYDLQIKPKDNHDYYFIFLLLCCIYGYGINTLTDKNFQIEKEFKKQDDEINNVGKHVINCNLKYINISDGNDIITVNNFTLLSKDGEVYKYEYVTEEKKFTKNLLCLRNKDRNQRDEKTLAFQLHNGNQNQLYEIYISYGTNSNGDYTNRISTRYFTSEERKNENMDKKQSQSVVCTTSNKSDQINKLRSKLLLYTDKDVKFKLINDINMVNFYNESIKIGELCNLYKCITLIERIVSNFNTEGKKSATIYYPNELLYKIK